MLTRGHWSRVSAHHPPVFTRHPPPGVGLSPPGVHPSPPTPTPRVGPSPPPWVSARHPRCPPVLGPSRRGLATASCPGAEFLVDFSRPQGRPGPLVSAPGRCLADTSQ